MPPSRVRIPPSPPLIPHRERCPSGLRSATGNRVRAERCVAGSNPALSASRRFRAARCVGEPLVPPRAPSFLAYAWVLTLQEPAGALVGPTPPSESLCGAGGMNPPARRETFGLRELGLAGRLGRSASKRRSSAS